MNLAEISKSMGPDYRLSAILTVSDGNRHVDISLSAADLLLENGDFKARVLDPAIAALTRKTVA